MTTHRAFPPWLLRKPDDTAAARLFCFPYSGVGASMFSRWPRWLGDVEVCPIQLPARENRIREPHYGTYEWLAADLVEPLTPYLDRPFAFFGHCAGSLPAFETAVRLAATRRPAPRQIVVSAQVAPHDCPRDRFLDMTDEQLTAELTALVIAQGGRPHPMLLQLTLSVLHEDLEANRIYRRPKPVALASGITVLSWDRDVEISAGELAGWDAYSSDVRFVELPGGHYEFLSAPSPLLDLLRDLTSPPAERAGARTEAKGSDQ
jgi:surfactin synthase thioesterase subunit